MFFLREYAAVVVLALGLAALLRITAGVGVLLNYGARVVFRSARKYAAAAAVVPLLAIPVLVQQPGSARQATPPADNPFTINVSVDEVVLHATVRNRKGTPVAGLSRENFQIFEDKVQQRIQHFSHDDIPVTVGILIDNSGSMRPKRAEVIAAALAFAASSNPLDQMFLVNFNEHVRFGLPSEVAFTDQPDQLRDAMRTVKADGKTALYDAVAAALEHLKLGNRDKKVLIVVSDGADNASSRTKQQVLALVAHSDAIIYALGVYEPEDPDRNPHVLTEFANASGGESYFPQELRDVRPVCERIAHEIRNQYTLTYVPTNTKLDGTRRVIEVRAETPEGKGLVVTTRTGYTAPLARASKSEARN